MPSLDYKRILLVHPLGAGAGMAASDIARKANLMPPLGLACIAAYLEREGFKADLLDFNADPDAARLLPEYLREHRPSLVGFSCTTASFLDGIRLAANIKTLQPETRTVFGGPHVSALGPALLEKFTDMEASVIGEGEAVMAELMKTEGDADAWASVKGLAYRQDGQVRFNGFRTEQLPLDDLPFPAYEKLPGYPDRYTLPIFSYPRTPNASCISSRGCPYECSYCDRSVFGRTFRFNSPGYVYEHMSYLRRRFGIRHLNFYDDQFTLHRGRVEELMKKLIDRPLGMTFNCAARAEKLDPALLALMKQAGAWMISLGIETGDPELLSQHRKQSDLSMLRDKIREIKRAGLRVKGLVMLGLPGETETSIRKSMDYVLSLPLNDLNIAKFTPFPGTPLYAGIHERGRFDENWEKMDCMHFLFVPEGIRLDRLQALFQEFYKRHFTRTRILLGYVAMLWQSPDSWLRFLKNLKAFLSFAFSNRRWGTPPDKSKSLQQN
ncbi:MAG TPA: B12-binding domain-containing radical SAM protein [Verrucomicrobia bacterium]|nr:MAG: B12-binding domain-containing radical SAM protein [Lentisphaerae bacterium GWF2_57_35]HBA86364.1 B12-binding domain-containing radical SAM protein [Verrucomicrobiota bacterium]